MDNTLVTSKQLEEKIDKKGKCKKYIGNTIIYTLPEEIIQSLELVQNELYDEIGEILAEKLNPHFFHMTLHDLLHGKPSDELREQIIESRELARKVHQKVLERNKTIYMEITELYNKEDMAIVIGLQPINEENMRLLDELYEEYQKVVKLPHKLRPHITIAYFKPGKYTKEDALKLSRLMEKGNNREKIQISLLPEMLKYQEFKDMLAYSNQLDEVYI